jgi:hypothetical protein
MLNTHGDILLTLMVFRQELPNIINFDQSQIFMEGVSGGSLMLSGMQCIKAFCNSRRLTVWQASRFLCLLLLWVYREPFLAVVVLSRE